MSTYNEQDDDFDLDVSQATNQSFLTSLDDNELIEFINKLSQSKKPQSSPSKEYKELPNVEITEDMLSGELSSLQDDPNKNEQLVNSNDLPPSSPKLSDEVLQLAQQQEQFTHEAEPVFGDYATYFAHKSKAQQEEDDQFLTWDHQRRVEQGLSPELPQIFKGCVIHVNGHTRPGIQTLHKLIILYGGKFIHHLGSKGAATHVIATRLTPKKIVEFKNYKVVKPEWITESIEQGKKLNWAEYSIIKVDYGQTRLPFEQQGSDEESDVVEENATGKVLDDTGYQEELIHDTQPANEIERNDVLPLTQSDSESVVNDVMIDEVIDARHPNFLKTFFAKSRLHHLSTWKSDLRAEFLSIALTQAKQKTREGKIPRGSSKVIMHIDFDCFFATASAISHPEIDFDNTPVCVSHGGNKENSSADIASCNYVCRKFGVKNGMWVRSAKRLCPELVCLDYDFPTYEKISKQFYEILVDLMPDCIFPVSVDEALLDVSSLIDEHDLVESVNSLCTNLRNKVYQLTKCSVSTGCSSNVLLAKLALRHAKPKGQYYLHENIDDFLKSINARDLPGTGYSIETKLMQEVHPDCTDYTDFKVTVEDLLRIDKSRLVKIFGVKTGAKLYDYARGKDDTSIDISENPQEFLRKSVSIDVNWGIRFDNIEQIDKFLFSLGKEMADRLNKLEMSASQMTLKLLKRAPDAPIDPPKYLGCGKCDAFSKSSKLGVPSGDFRIFGTESRSLFRNIGCDPQELRGVSLSVSKLVPNDQVGNQKRLPFKKVEFEFPKKQKLNDKTSSPNTSTNISRIELKATQYQIPSDIDSSVLDELPSSVRKEIRQQRDKSNECVLEIPKEVDLEVFNSLPPDIQSELREELRRRKIAINPQTPQKDRKSYLQQVWPIDGSQPQFIRVISPKKSPSKKFKKQNSPGRRSPSKSPIKYEKYDEGVLNELPTSLRENIIKEWKQYEEANKTEFSKIKESLKSLAANTDGDRDEIDEPQKVEFLGPELFDQLSTPLTFQKRKRPREITDLVEKWVLHTKHKGPHSKDYDLFQRYIKSLLKENIIFALNLMESLDLILKMNDEICEKWNTIFKDLKKDVKLYCQEQGKFYRTTS